MSDELNKKFNIVPRKDEPVPLATIQDNVNVDAAINDFGVARANIMTVLEAGSTAVGSLADMAYSSQDPEHYSALASMIKAVTAASDKLLNLHKRVEELKDKHNNKSEVNSPTVHNHLHLTSASTSELAAALKQIRRD